MNRFDVAIVGSGIAGATLAAKLPQDMRIVLVEAGSDSRHDRPVLQTHTGLPFRWPETTCIEVGGTSNLWHGVLSPLDPIDFAERSWIPKSGWPIARSELDRYYLEAAEFLGLEQYDYFDPRVSSHGFASQLQKVAISDALSYKYFQQPKRIPRLKRVVQTLGGNVRVLRQHVALELVAGASEGTVDHIRCFDLSRKEFETIRASHIVVCAGALETPRLLLNSKGIAAAANRNVGRYLMDHPMGNVMQIGFHRAIGSSIYSDTRLGNGDRIKVGLVLDENVQCRDHLPNNNFFFRPSFVEGLDPRAELVKLSLLTVRNNRVSARDVWNIVSNLNLTRQILAYKLTLAVKMRFADIFVMSEQVPHFDSCVSLANVCDDFGYRRANVHWELSPYDLTSMVKYQERVRAALLRDSNVRVTVEPKIEMWRSTFTSAAHHVGTARMGKSSADAVVDRDLRVFGMDNLHVCDGSVFATSGNVNSGLTIAALACRLAHSLPAAMRASGGGSLS